MRVNMYVHKFHKGISILNIYIFMYKTKRSYVALDLYLYYLMFMHSIRTSFIAWEPYMQHYVFICSIICSYIALEIYI